MTQLDEAKTTRKRLHRTHKSLPAKVKDAARSCVGQAKEKPEKQETSRKGKQSTREKTTGRAPTPSINHHTLKPQVGQPTKPSSLMLFNQTGYRTRSQDR